MKITEKDRRILRDLAKHQYEISQSEEMQQLRKLWTDHNDCKPSRPVLTVELWTFADDVIPSLLRCEGEDARQIEWRLHSNLVNHEIFRDDTVVPDYWGVGCKTWFVPYGIPVRKELSAGGGLGHHFVEVLHDLGEDFHKLKKSDFGADPEANREQMEFYQDLFDGCLPVKEAPIHPSACLTQHIVHIMSMENMLFAMYDYPELFHQMMEMLTEDYLEFYRLLEEKKLLMPTVSGENLCQGTRNFTTDLPGWDVWKTRPFTTRDVWGYMDSQETSGISPEMYAEFIFPYYQKIAAQYGLLSYGCCEAVSPIWENCISKLDNLRKVSISPWCDEEYMGEQLAGRKTIFHRKPSPNFLGVGSVLDEEGLRAHFDRTLRAAKGCILEFSQRDVYTLHNTPQKVARYVEILREECDKLYQG
ncbi:MAG: hypothetical protein ACOX6P_04490 [Candidatus Merdivicinus sp.]|jgi:hypothetical protein